MSGEDEGFLSRWSRLKRTAPEAEAVEPPAAPEPEPAPPQPVEPTPLPDIETLTRESDYTPFLKADVPADLQRQALRKLWASDPIFSQHDGLTDYAEDFRNPEIVGDAVKTAWKIGKGFLDDEAETPLAAAEPREEADGDTEAPG